MIYNFARRLVADITRPSRKFIEKKFRYYFILKRSVRDKKRSIIRHEAHRIEKAYYNDVFLKNPKIYKDKAEIIKHIFASDDSGLSLEPDMRWAKEISENYNTLDEKFIDTSKIKNRHEYELEKFSSIMEERRSNRTWCEIQPSSAEFQDLVNRLISYAAHMPYLCLF